MNIRKITMPLSIIFLICTYSAKADLISANSLLNMSHSFIINNGNSPTGIEVHNLSTTLVIESDATSFVDDPAFTNSSTSNFQVGNPFSSPPLPVLSSRSDTTINLGNADFATGSYNYSITMEDDPDEDNFDITRREIEQSGSASASLLNSPADASASSSHLGGRSFRFDNVSNDEISFNITGLFETEMSASYDGENGFARTTGGFEMLFNVGAGSSVDYLSIAPYLFDIDDNAVGAMVSELFLANSGGINGVSFSGMATAIGDGTETLAELYAQAGYLFNITLEAGASLIMETGFSQSNEISSTMQTTSVPEPTSFSLLLAGIFGFTCLRRIRSTV